MTLLDRAPYHPSAPYSRDEAEAYYATPWTAIGALSMGGLDPNTASVGPDFNWFELQALERAVRLQSLAFGVDARTKVLFWQPQPLMATARLWCDAQQDGTFRLITTIPPDATDHPYVLKMRR